MKSHNGTLLQISSIAGLALAIVAGLSCGRPDDADQAGTTTDGNTYMPVDGLAAYGTQCPYGSISGVKPLRLQLWNCPIGGKSVELGKNIPPLYLEADCRGRVLSIRTEDRRVDTSWYFLPNGEFDVVVDGLNARIRGAGPGSSDCAAPLSINLTGKVDCGSSDDSLDQATINFQSVMWAGSRPKDHGSSVPVPKPSATPGLPPPPVPDDITNVNQCSLPQSCYFYTQSELKQCQ